MSRMRARRPPDDLVVLGWILVGLVGVLVDALALYLAFVHQFAKHEKQDPEFFLLLILLGVLGTGIFCIGVYRARRESKGR